MAIDAGEVLASPSSHLRRQDGEAIRQYYVAVDRLQFKMETLVDLLDVIGRRSSLPVILCCSSRDELDAVCANISNLTYISLSSLYSDMAESERSLTIDRFRQATLDWNHKVNAPEELVEAKVEGQRSSVLVVTDACLPLIAAGESPFSARVLVNYELPTKKETYLRRISTCLPSDGVVINMVVGGEVVILKSIEEGCGIIIEEMPIHISEIL
ncbi:uncharacterized protein LOC116258466 [Nymphaea colorata]|nr:uncharacterized protein LOC116258466 [Nymphaea colorata]